MPHTVPNSPTKGAVEPTVARNASPSPRRLATLSIARWIDADTQSERLMLPSRPVCLDCASSPDSAMKRNGLPSFRPSAPCFTDGAPQKDFSAMRASRPSLYCSYTLVTMMYQLPIDMIARMISVPLATQSLPRHSASRPYGFSTISVPFAPLVFAAGAVVAAGTAAGAAAGAGVAAGAGWACACDASGVTAAAAATMSSAASVAQRVVFSMISPDRFFGFGDRRRRTQSDSPAGERGLMVDQQSLILSLGSRRPVQHLLPD